MSLRKVTNDTLQKSLTYGIIIIRKRNEQTEEAGDDMPFLIFFLWLISPLVLIPYEIWLVHKKDKLKNFIRELYRQGRINLEEYNSLNAMPQTPPPNPMPQNQPQPFVPPPVAPQEPVEYRPMQMPINAQAENLAETAQTEIPYQQYLHEGKSQPKEPVQLEYIPTEKPDIQAAVRAAAGKPKVKRERNYASALLVIGASMVILAGIVFSIAAWLRMNDWQRVELIGLASVFFFGMSTLAHKKLKLENTGIAFYMLGSVFAAITFVTAGYFKLLGEWLSVSGEGFLLLYALAAVMITAFSAGVVKIYKKGAFAHAVLYGGMCSFTLMSLQFFGTNDVWAMFLNIVSAIPIYLLYKQKLKFGTLYDDPLKPFTAILAGVYAMAALPFMLAEIGGNWTVPCFVTAGIWLVQAAVYGYLLNNKLLKKVHVPLSAFVALEAALAIGKDTHTDLHIVSIVFAVLIFALGIVYRYVKPIRSRFSDAFFPILLFLDSLTVVYDIAQSAEVFMLISVLMSVLTALQVFGGKGAIYKNAFSLSLIHTALAISCITSRRNICFIAIIIIVSMVFRYYKRVRTSVTDAIFPLTMFVTILSILSDPLKYSPIDFAFASVALTAMFAVQSFGKEKGSEAYKRLLAISAVITSYSAAELVTSAVNLAYKQEQELYCLSLMLVMFAMSFVFANVSAICTEISDIIFPVMLCSVSVYVSNSGELAAYLIAMSGFVLTAVIMFILSCEERKSAIAVRNLIAIPFIGTAITGANSINIAFRIGYSNTLFVTGIFIIMFAFAFRYSEKFGLNCRTLTSDIMFVMSAVTTVLVSLDRLYGFIDESISIIVMCVMTSLLVFAYVMERKPRHRNFVLFSRWLFPCLLMLTAYTVNAAIINSFYALPNEATGHYIGAIVFIILMVIISVCFARIGKIRTTFSDFAIPIVMWYYCVELNDYSYKEPENVIAPWACLVLCGMLLMYGLEKNSRGHLFLHRAAAPIAALAFINIESERMHILSYGVDIIGLGVLIIVSLVFTLMNEKHSRKELSQLQYMWTIAAAYMCINNDRSYDFIVWASCALITGCFALYFVCARQKNNLIAVVPALSICRAAQWLAYGLSLKDRANFDIILILIYMLAFFMFGIVSKRLAPFGIVSKGKKQNFIPTAITITACTIIAAAFGNTIWQLMSIACITAGVIYAMEFVRAWKLTAENNAQKGIGYIDFAAFAMMLLCVRTWFSDGEWSKFIALFEAALCLLGFVRQSNRRKANLVLLTLASASSCLMIYARPFLKVSDRIIAAKINLIPILLFSMAVKKIWKNDRKIAENFGFMADLTAFIVLIIDGLLNKSLDNTIFVLCVTLAIILLSFAYRHGRWFAVSTATFIGLTMYITNAFTGRVEWWVYLLAAGLLLILVAAANEYLKSRGKSLREELETFKKRWR